MAQRTVNVKQYDQVVEVMNSLIKIRYDLSTGEYSYYMDGKKIILKAYSNLKLGENVYVNSREAKKRIFEKDDIKDGFGYGIKVSVRNQLESGIVMKQNIYVYEDKQYFFIEEVVESTEEIHSNYMAPLVLDKKKSSEIINIGNVNDPRILFIPFDNDKWIRYESNSIVEAKESYEVTAIFDNTSRKGLILGSITHDTWKTGIQAKADSHNQLQELTVYGGAAGPLTRDSIPHGSIFGKKLISPKIFVGLYEDYRTGMEQYGEANAVIAPPPAWEEGVPFGWNSWSALGNKLSYETYIDTSDFIKEKLQDKGFHNNGVVYINFDAFWNSLSEEQIKEAVKHVHDNGQKPGIYWTPFAYWSKDDNVFVEGTDGEYLYKDILLKDYNGSVLPTLDGGIPIDPTHPGTLKRMDWQCKRFIDWGFDYVKLDFMAHGALEGNHYHTDLTTGIQAYNYGMNHIVELLDPEKIGHPFLINLSIAPMFPSNYAHSRRISCDAFGLIDDTEYMLNSLTYGWWMNDTIYKYNDPDHTVLYKSFNREDVSTEQEARSRLNASIIAGTSLLLGDDYHFEKAQARTEKLMANQEIISLAKRGISFKPTEGNTGDKATDIFILDDVSTNHFYIAIFNYSIKETLEKKVDLERIGLQKDKRYVAYDLWNRKNREGKNTLEVVLGPTESTIFRIKK